MDKNKNRNLMAKIICVLLSFGLWLYITNVENPVRNYDIKNIPVELINTDAITNSKFSLVQGQKFVVDLKVEGPSSEISKIRPEDFKIVADMSNYALKSGNNTIPVQIMSYPDNITIKNSGFLGINVELEDIKTKEITIKSNIKVTYKNGIHELEQKISPETVKITGGKSIVDRVNSAVITGEEKDVSKNIEKNYAIKLIDADGNEITGVDSDVSSAKLSITVTTGKKVAVNLKTTGQLPKGYEIEGYDLTNKYIEITGEGSDNIESIDTEPLDISSFTESTEANVNLSLPTGITILNGGNSVKVTLNIKKLELATKTITSSVKYNNLKENLSIESSTENVNIVLEGLQSDLDQISDKDITASVDLEKIESEGKYSYKPDISLANNDGKITVNSIGSVNIVVKKKE